MNFTQDSSEAPRTPTRPLPSPWERTNLELTPSIESPAEIRTSDTRLINAKRESEHALAVCRGRIEALQLECAQSKGDAEAATITRQDLEQEIYTYRTRIASLERSKVDTETQLELTRSRLDQSTSTEGRLEQELHETVEKIAFLQQASKDRQHAIDSVHKDKDSLEALLQTRNARIADLESHTMTLENSLDRLQKDLESARRYESSLQDRLAEKENAREDLRCRLDRGSQYVEILQQKISDYSMKKLKHDEEMEAHNGFVSTLRGQLGQSDEARKNTEVALLTLEGEITLLKQKLETESNSQHQLAAELKSSQRARADVELELYATKHMLQQEREERDRLQTELHTLQTSYDSSKNDLQAAQGRILSLETLDRITQQKLETLRDGKTALEADLKDTRQSLFKLREDVRMSHAKLCEVERSTSDLQQQLRVSEEQSVSLEDKLNEACAIEASTKNKHAIEMQMVNAELEKSQSSVLSLQTVLASSEESKKALQEDMRHTQTSKATIESQLTNLLQAKQLIQSKHDCVQAQLSTTEANHHHLLAKLLQLEMDHRTSSEAKSDLEKSLEAALNDKTATQSRLSELETALDDSDSARRAVEEALVTVRKENEASGFKIERLHGQLDKANGSNATLEATLQKSMTAKTDVESQLLVAHARSIEVEKAADVIQLQLKSLTEEIQDLQKSKVGVENRLQTVQESYQKQHEELSFAQLHLETVEAEAKELRQELVSAFAEIHALQQGKDVLGDSLKEALDRHSNLERDLRTSAQENENVQSQLQSAFDLSKQAKTEIDLVLVGLDAEGAKRSPAACQKETVLDSIRLLKDDIHRKLDHTKNAIVGLEKDLAASRSRLQELEKQGGLDMARLCDTEDELAESRLREAGFQEHLELAETNQKNMRADFQRMESHATELDQVRSDLLLQLQTTDEEMRELRLAYAQVKNRHQATSLHEGELLATQMRLDIAESEGLSTNLELVEALQELTSLRTVNDQLAASEQKLLARLSMAEEDLASVRKTNAHLETFLERVENDMTNAQAAVEESGQRLEDFLHESQAKLNVVTNSKLKYKRTLGEKNGEIEALVDQNLELNGKLVEQTQELDEVKKSKAQLEEDLVGKKKYIKDLKSSSDKRIRSLNSAYNGLRKQHEERLKIPTSPHSTTASSHVAQAASMERSEVSSDRPQTRGSVLSGGEDLDHWTREIDLVRGLRNETAGQLRELKKSRHDLRKTLKEAEAQLHRLEKERKP